MNRIPSALPSDMLLGSVSVAWQKALSEEGASLQDGQRTPPVLCLSDSTDPPEDHLSVALSTQTPHTPGVKPLPSYPLAKNYRPGTVVGKPANFSAIQ